MNCTRALLLLALLLPSIAAPALSQQAAAHHTESEAGAGNGGHDLTFGLSAGYSWYSTTQWGIIRNRHVSMLDARLEAEMGDVHGVTLAYTLEIPFVVIARKSDQVTNACWTHYPTAPCIRDSSSTAEAGIGIIPVGLKAYFGPAGHPRFFTQAAGGIVAFSGNVPVSEARRFNFTAEGGIGVEIPAGVHALTLGYKFVHISNGDSAPSNPGLDANVLFVGLMRRALR